MKSIENKLTILLTLKGRESFTYRWLEYSNNIRLPFRIYIADGGKNNDISAHLSNQSKYPNLDIKYRRYPFDKDRKAYKKKLINSINEIETKYMIFADNDDFILTNGIKDSLNYMEKNEQCSCAKGRIGFVKLGLMDGKNNHYLYGQNNTYWLPDSLSINAKTALDRFKLFLYNYSQTTVYANYYYGINRTKDIKEVFRKTLELNLNDIFLDELLVSGLVAINGNVKSEDYLYLIRQRNTEQSSANTFAKKFGNEFDRVFLETWSNDFSLFIQTISESIEKNDDLHTENVQNHIVSAYKQYIAPLIFNRLKKQYNLSDFDKNLNRIVRFFNKFNNTPRKKFQRIHQTGYQDVLSPIESVISQSKIS